MTQLEVKVNYDVFGRMTNKEWAKFGNLQQQIKEKEDETNNI